MTEKKTQRSQQKDATREVILNAATKLLAENGYAALRVAAVAKEAGVSLGGQLHHFPSKDSLVIAVLERLSERVMRLLQKAERASVEGDILMHIANSAQRFYAAPEFLIYLDIFLSVRRHTLVGDTAIRLLLSQRAATESLWVPHLTRQGISEKNAYSIVRILWGLARGLAVSSAGEQGRAADQATMELVIKALRKSGLDKRD